MARGDGGRGRLRRNKKETRKERGGSESIKQVATYGQCEAERRDQDRRRGGAVRQVGDREGEGEGRRKEGTKGEGNSWESTEGGSGQSGREGQQPQQQKKTHTDFPDD